MAHVFVAPHPDDVALSCGGLIASLRELGQNVTIVTVFSGTGGARDLTSYQRDALGFGSKTLWPVTEAFNRANIAADVPTAGEPLWAATDDRLEATQAEADAAAKSFWQRSSWYRRASIRREPLADQPLMDEVPTQGAVLTVEVAEAAASGDVMARRRLEDERYAYFAEASVVFLDLPDAVFRGYEGDAQLLGAPRDDDPAPIELVRQEILRLEPQKVYLPLAVGGHVDHRHMRDVGLAMLADARRWVMPGPEWAGTVVFYEDFPYAWWTEFRQLDDLADGHLADLPQGISLFPEYADITDQVERKIAGIGIYESQVERLFEGGRKPMAQAVRGYGRDLAELGGVPGIAERYWTTTSL
jgi:LmbE family N-acetylglucosaminyl deacetylase